MENYDYPTTRETKHDYYAIVIAYMILNKTRLKIEQSVIDNLLLFYGDANNPPLGENTYLYLYPLWTAKKTTRTTQITEDLNDSEKSLDSNLSTIYQDIPGSIWTNADRLTFRRKYGDKAQPTFIILAISENVFVRITSAGKGKIKIKCYTANDAGRASLLKNAIGIEVRWLIFDPAKIAQETDIDVVAKLKKAATPSLGDCTDKEVYFTSIFILEVGEDFSGQTIQMFFRWRNKDLKLSGPFGDVVTFTVP